MLRCIGACTLPREPRQVCLIHHYVEGLVISAVRYNAHAYLDTEQSNTLCYPTATTVVSAETNKDGTNEEVDETSNYFTVVEAAIPLSGTQAEGFTTVNSNNNTNTNVPPVRTITVPVPGAAVHALTLLHRESGREVYVLVQCATEKDNSEGKTSYDTAAYIFRRVLMHSSSEEEDEDKEGHHETGIRYVRMPRPVDDEHRVWSALTTLDGELLHHEHSNNISNSRTTANGSASQTSSQASTSSSAAATAGVVLVVAAAEGKANVDPALQVFAVSATRAERYATCALPILAGLSITQLVPCTGKPGHLLLLCPHLIAEVTLSVSQDEQRRVLVRPTRVWRCSPSDVLIVCTLKEHYLYAGTAQGTLLLWDTHLTTTSDNVSNSEKLQDKGNDDDEEGGCGSMAVGNKTSDNSGALIGVGEATGTAINGLHAVYATEFYTCAMDGAMRGWRYVQEGTVHDGYTMEGAHRHKDSDTRVERMLGGTAAFVPVIEAEADMRVTYGGLNAAVSMAGVEHYMAVVHEEGQMRLYMSA